MAEDDDERSPQSDGRREYATRDDLREEHRERRRLVDQLDANIGTVQRDVGVLKVQVAEARGQADRNREDIADLRREAEIRERAAKRHADALVSAMKKDLQAAAARWIAITAALTGVATFLVNLLTRHA